MEAAARVGNGHVTRAAISDIHVKQKGITFGVSYGRLWGGD